MIWVGLTGGIASGKSTVSNFLKQEGAFIIDADKIVHTLLQERNPVYASIVKSFGREILNDEKKIDRRRLGNLVFRNPEQRNRLNQIVHPFVFQKAEDEKKRLGKNHPKAVIVFDAALLIETEAHKKMDWVLLAYVNPVTQRLRLMQRDHLSSQDAAMRIAAQMPIDQKVAYADEVIDCSQTLDKVRGAVQGVYGRLKVKAENLYSSP